MDDEGSAGPTWDLRDVREVEGAHPVRLDADYWVPSRLLAEFDSEGYTVQMAIWVSATGAQVRRLTIESGDPFDLGTPPVKATTAHDVVRLGAMREAAVDAATLRTYPAWKGAPAGAFRTSKSSATAYVTGWRDDRPPASDRVRKAAEAYLAFETAHGRRGAVQAVREAVRNRDGSEIDTGAASDLVKRARQAGLIPPANRSETFASNPTPIRIERNSADPTTPSTPHVRPGLEGPRISERMSATPKAGESK